jgi:GAF domain
LATRTASDLEQILDELEKMPPPPLPEALGCFSSAIAEIFQLKPDEVAILEIMPPGRMLRFVVPAKLGSTGTIPLNSASALVARTARMRRPGIINNFSTLPHASVFEGVPLGRGQQESIQKILSAPILRENRVIGVVQLSRKGFSPTDAGPDFGTVDMAKLQDLAPLFTRFLTISRPS